MNILTSTTSKQLLLKSLLISWGLHIPISFILRLSINSYNFFEFALYSTMFISIFLGFAFRKYNKTLINDKNISKVFIILIPVFIILQRILIGSELSLFIFGLILKADNMILHHIYDAILGLMTYWNVTICVLIAFFPSLKTFALKKSLKNQIL